MWAAFESQPNAMRRLIAAGADLNAADCNGWTALMHAAAADSEQSVAILLDARADLTLKNAHGKTVLWLARYSPRIVRLLQRHGARE